MIVAPLAWEVIRLWPSPVTTTSPSGPAATHEWPWFEGTSLTPLPIAPISSFTEAPWIVSSSPRAMMKLGLPWTPCSSSLGLVPTIDLPPTSPPGSSLCRCSASFSMSARATVATRSARTIAGPSSRMCRTNTAVDLQTSQGKYSTRDLAGQAPASTGSTLIYRADTINSISGGSEPRRREDLPTLLHGGASAGGGRRALVSSDHQRPAAGPAPVHGSGPQPQSHHSHSADG